MKINNNSLSEYTLSTMTWIIAKKIYLTPLFPIKWNAPNLELIIPSKKCFEFSPYKYLNKKWEDDAKKTMRKNIIMINSREILWSKFTVKPYFSSKVSKYVKYCKLSFIRSTIKNGQNE